MAISAGSAYINIDARLSDLEKKLKTGVPKAADRATKDAGSRMTAGFKKIAVGLGAVFAGQQAFAFVTDAISDASDLNEAVSKSQVVFGDAQASVLEWSETTASSIGQSQADALAAAGTFGNFFRTIKVGEGDAADMSKRLTVLASDLASFNNADPAEVVDALGAALRGEAEPMSRFGVLMNEATLKDEALRQGLITTTKDALTPQQKAMAAYGLILEQTKTAQGDFARTSDGAANQQRILAAQFEDVRAKLGEQLLPIVTKVAQYLSTNMPRAVDAVRNAFNRVKAWIDANWPTVRDTIVRVVDQISGYVRPVLAVLADAWRIFGDNIIRQVRNAFTAIQTVIGAALQIVRGVFRVFAGVFTGDWSRAWSGVKDIFSGIWETITGVFRYAWETLKNLAGTAIDGIVVLFSTIGERIGSALAGLGDIITAPFRAAWNALANLWNSGPGALEFSIPSWVPGLGGNSFDVPEMPTLHDGGIYRAPAGRTEGPALLEDGEMVLTREQQRVLGSGRRGVTIINNWPTDPDLALAALRRAETIYAA